MNEQLNLTQINKKLDSINKRNPATISQWLKCRDEWDKYCQSSSIFKVGTLMPLVSNQISHLIPDKKKAHLFGVYSSRHFKIIDINNKSEFKRGRWVTVIPSKHEVHAVSVSVFKGRKLEWLKGPSDVISKYILPEGWTWKKDDNGICCIDPDGIDYHPFWHKDVTIGDILLAHAQNKQRRIEQLESARINKLSKSLLENQLNTTYVLLEDSRNVGNCVEGSLQFAKRVLNIDREQILECPHIFKVPAIKLYGKDPRATNACIRAFQRETVVSI